MENNKIACVTGASGFIASHICKQLLDKGYIVNATVRDLNNPEKVDHLKSLNHASSRLNLFQSDLMTEHSFDAPVANAEVVFHVAASLPSNGRNTEETVFTPSVVGTDYLMSAVKKTNSVKCICFTSSLTATNPNVTPAIKTEEHYTDVETARKQGKWYNAAKVVCERNLEKFCNANNIRLTIILPTMVYGPYLGPNINATNRNLKAMVSGIVFKSIINDSFSMIDVRDCAAQHIASYEQGDGFHGRFLSVVESLHLEDLMRVWKTFIPSYEIPTKKLYKDEEKATPTQYDLTKMNSLNVKVKTIHEVLMDAFQELMDKGEIPRYDLKNQKIACVTGASGFIASHIVQQLLNKGYTVNATVRDPSAPDKVDHLKKLKHASERLILYKSDLLKDGSFDLPVANAQVIFHAATALLPLAASTNGKMDDQTEEGIFIPTVKGNENIMNSVIKKANNLDCFVFTSSVAATNPNVAPVVKTEAHYTDVETAKREGKWYNAAKVVCERALERFCSTNNIRLAILLPTMVYGPMLQPNINLTMEAMKQSFLGNAFAEIINDSFSMIDVRDCAAQHIAAYEKQESEGRYLSVIESIHLEDLMEIMKYHYPNYQIPSKKTYSDAEKASPSQYNVTKMNTLGVNVRSISDTVQGIVEDLVSKGYLPEKKEIGNGRIKVASKM